ncbi:MAG: hypothetical protein PHS41_09070, partial [Victivallaceae bacterium]|nr:hypothetical protein [Victivallaceae bacterium]
MTNSNELIFFRPNRVWRCYLGGKLLDEMHGKMPGSDTLYPEDWLGSTTRASNGEHQSSPDEGLAKLPDGELFTDLLARQGKQLLGEDKRDLGVLCKFLDSAVRLPIQCHPDKPFAKTFFHSDHGKTESWFILETRKIDGEEPYLLMGFNDRATPERFASAVARQDLPAILAMMNKVPVSRGDSFLIPGRFPHAIGPGVLMLEVQEPSDWVIQPEEKIGDVTLSHTDMWSILDEKTGLACFDYTAYTPETAAARCRLRPRGDGFCKMLVGPSDTDCFCVERLNLAERKFAVITPGSWRLSIVTEGNGIVKTSSGQVEVHRGEVFLIPHGIGEVRFEAQTNLTVYLVTDGR